METFWYFLYRLSSFLCLNRTMQYGNGGLTEDEINKEIKFKSYYVVWKQNKIKYKTIKWQHCLNRTMQYGNRVGGARQCGVQSFKSYYVVWKLFFPSLNFFTIEGLNRTMQYGNPCCFTRYHTNGKFKSYYVVWKLFFGIVAPCGHYCLNRTMQYGNPRL